MAKKKNKKAQKAAEWTSPPPSPKAAPEEPAPASLPLSPETLPTESTPDASIQSLGSPTEAKTDDAPVDEPAPELATQEPVVEDVPLAEKKQETSEPKEEEKTESAPEVEVNPASSDEPVPESQEPLAKPEPEATNEAIPAAAAELVAETLSEESPPADDDWGSFGAVSSSKKKKGKKGKKAPKIDVPAATVEAPEAPEVPEVPEAPEAPEPPIEILEKKEEEPMFETEEQPTSEEAQQVEQPLESVEAESQPSDPSKVEEQAAEPPKPEEPTVDDWTPPSKPSKKGKKKGKKSKDQSGVATPAEEAPAEVLPEPVEAVSASEPVPEPAELVPEPAEPVLEPAEPVLEPAEPVLEPAEPVPEPIATESVPIPEMLDDAEPAKESEPEPPTESQPEPQPESRTEPEAEPQPVPIEVASPPIPEPPPPAPVEVKSPPVPEPPSPVPAPVEAERSPLPKPASPIPVAVEARSPPATSPASPISAPIKERSPPTPKPASPIPPQAAPEYYTRHSRSITNERRPSPLAPSRPQPKSEAINQAIDEDRPPAPSPPVTKVRPRRAPVYDDDDEDDSAIIQPRLRSEALSRDSSRGSYPPSHARPLFASRVPTDHYSNPPPPPAPPQYHHPRHYSPAAPPYYHAPSYSMSQNSGYPGHSPYGPPSHASSPYQESWGRGPSNYGPYNGHSPPQRHDSLGSRDYPPGLPAIENGSAIEDESGDVFSRIAQAIPDLHVLLAKYKETSGQLGVREELLRRASAEQQEKLRVKDEEIVAMKERISSMEHKHSTEASRLRLEVGNMEEQVKELKDHLVETEKFRVEAGQLKVALEATMKSWESKYKELEEAHATLQKNSTEEMAKTRSEFEEWKTVTTTRNDAEKIALAIQFDKKIKEAEVMGENLRQEAAAAFVKEKDDLRSEHQRQQREREVNFDALRKELENKLGASQLDCEQALKRERETMEVWAKERGTLVQAHREDIESLRKSWEEQRSLLEGQHRKIKEESDKAWVELHAEANRKAEENKALAEQLMKDKEELLKQYNDLKLEHEKEKQIIKSVASNIENEKLRLEKLMESYGDIAEIKSKGDTYYLVSFTQLQKQILDLAATHFVHLPVTPPAEDLQQIPHHLPSFLADTSASRQLRTAYVAHTVSKLVTYRVFGPFLFSLGRRYDKADSLFLSMSNHIRDKSTRKEAIWRQQTLLAAFTSSGAKQRINTAAGAVVEEIVNAIKNFADPKEEEGIKIAVKRIVKLAAETWRFARLEREMICATMPAIRDEDHQFTGPEFWPSHRPEGTPIPSLVGTVPPSDEKPKLMLRLFPVIYREPKHENFRETENEKPDEGCIYHYGLALYDDAEPVVQRAEELKAAGLPPTAATSPTAADFPPPLLPAPRTSLPPPPEGDKTSAGSKSPRSQATKETDNVSIRPMTPTSIKSGKSSIRSRTPPPVPPKRSSIRSKSSLSGRSDKASMISSTSSRPPLPPLSNPNEPPSSLKQARPEHAQAEYTRPPPGPVDYETPGDIPPLPQPTEVCTAGPTDGEANASADAVPADAVPADAVPLPAPTETISIAPSASLAILAAEFEDTPTPPLPAPTESATIPPFDPSASNLPTPPLTGATTPARPVSPLFAATVEIEALSSHRSRRTSSSRRSARSRPSDEELKDASKDAPKDKPQDKDRPDTTRRASGYSLNTRSTETASLRTESTDRPSSGRNSRYLCESRSAAIKGLYPNSPLAGQSPNLSRTNSLRSQKRKSGEVGTWDMSTGLEGAGEGAPTNP